MNTQFEDNDQSDENQTRQTDNTDLDANEKISLQNAYPPSDSTNYNKSTENQDQSPPQESDYLDPYNKSNYENAVNQQYSQDGSAIQSNDNHEDQETQSVPRTDNIPPKQEKSLHKNFEENELQPQEPIQKNENKRNSNTEYSFDKDNIALVKSEVILKKESNRQNFSQSASNNQNGKDYKIGESQKEKINQVKKAHDESDSDSKTWNSENHKGTEPFKEAKKLENIPSEEPQKLQRISRNSSIEDSNKSLLKNHLQGEGAVSQVSKKETMRISKTIETQTNDIEFPSSYVTGLQSERVDITIPETKVIKDGLIYTYLVYKIVTKLNDDEDNTEFVVYRRYSDFDWLFENLASKYDGYIIPVPPPKNILTAFSKEGVEFAETRKKELVVFLRKCMQHPFLRNTPEINIFLSDDKGFQDFKKKEQTLQQNKTEASLLSNMSKMLNGPTKTNPLVFRELNELESDIHNFEVIFSNLGKRLQSFSTNVLDYLQLKRKQTTTLISFTHDLESILVDSRSSKLEEAFRKITRANISRIDDDFIKDYTEKIEIHLKDITNNVEAINDSIDRRNCLVKELGLLHEKIEEKNLKFKKDASMVNGEELEDLRKEFERLKKRCQEASEILIKELKLAKQRVDHDLSVFIQNISQRKGTYFLEVYNLWAQTSESE